MKIERYVLHDASSSHKTWQNLSTISSIRQMGVNLDDSHLRVSSKPLIKDEEANQMAKPNCSLFIPMFFDGKSIFKFFEQSNCLNISILESLAFFFLYTHFHV